MRVLMTADTVGGVWTYALELADALAAGGVEVSLAAMGAPLTRDQRVELRRSRIARAFAEDYALEWMDEPWRDVDRAGRWLEWVAGRVEPDVVHVNGYAHAALPWEAPVVVVGHSCVLSWHEAVRGRPAGAEWRRYREAVERGLAAADLLVAPTRAMLDDLARLYDPPGPRAVVPNGRRDGAPPLRGAKQPFVLAAGRIWDEGKKLRALARLAPRLPWRVAIAGEGDAGACGLGRVGRAELDALLARAAIFAAPSRYEPFGLAALEAGLAGCALVLGDLPSLREVWGEAASFVPPGDDAALERALLELIERPELRRDLAARARARAATYTPERMAAGYLDAYRRVLEPARAEAVA